MGRFLTVGATALMLAFNALANALPLGGKTTGDIADGFDIMFTPAGYVFSIWGLIYVALIGFTIVQALPQRRNDPVLAELRPWYVLNALANAAWLCAWHYEQFALSWLIMITLLTSLVVIYRNVESIGMDDPVRYVSYRAPFSLYFGWICVATIANTTVLLWHWGLTGPLSDPSWTLILLGIATATCVTLSLRYADPIYASVFAWAFVGIALANTGESIVYAGALALAGLCAMIAGGTTVVALRARPKQPAREVTQVLYASRPQAERRPQYG